MKLGKSYTISKHFHVDGRAAIIAGCEAWCGKYGNPEIMYELLVNEVNSLLPDGFYYEPATSGLYSPIDAEMDRAEFDEIFARAWNNISKRTDY